MAFGNPVESVEETGEAAIEPGMAPRAWGFMPTPANLEPRPTKAIEVIKDALLKGTHVVRARHLVRRVPARHVSKWFLKRVRCLWFQPRNRYGRDRSRVGKYIESCLYTFVFLMYHRSWRNHTFFRRWETFTSTIVSTLLGTSIFSELRY